MKGFKKDGKFRPTEKRNKSSLKLKDLKNAKSTKTKPKSENYIVKPDGTYVDLKKRQKETIEGNFDFKNPEIEDGRKEKEILIGKDKHGEAVVLNVDVDGDYFSVSGHEYGMDDALTDEEGELRAKEYLSDDDYLWKQAVENGDTQLGFDEWVDSVLEYDYWFDILGDYVEMDNGKWVRLDSAGQIDVHQDFKDWEELAIDEKDLKTILKTWKKLHLKNFDTLNDKDKKLVVDAVEVFRKYPKFDKYTDMSKYTGDSD